MLLAMCTEAQVRVVPEKKQISPGEPLPVQISIESTVRTRPALSDTLGPFEILQQDSPTIRQSGARYLFSQRLVLTSFDSGRLLLPAVQARDADVTPSQPDTILVQRLPSDSLKGYTDIRDYFPIAENNLHTIVRWVLALAALLSGLGLYLLLRRRRKSILPEESSIRNKEGWMREWQRLADAWNAGSLQHEQAAEFIMILCRALFSLRGKSTHSSTGAELVRQAQQQWPANQWQPLKTIVSYCYSILFAKQEPERGLVAEQIRALRHLGEALIPSPDNEQDS